MSAAVSWKLVTPACGAMISAGFAGTPRQCQGWVTHAGVTLLREPLEAWRAFACRAHSRELIAPRELLDRDRVVIADWQAREQTIPWRRPEPLAVGEQAWELVRRAEEAR